MPGTAQFGLVSGPDPGGQFGAAPIGTSNPGAPGTTVCITPLISFRLPTTAAKSLLVRPGDDSTSEIRMLTLPRCSISTGLNDTTGRNGPLAGLGWHGSSMLLTKPSRIRVYRGIRWTIRWIKSLARATCSALPVEA